MMEIVAGSLQESFTKAAKDSERAGSPQPGPSKRQPIG